MSDDGKDPVADTATRIRDVALELFARQGYEKTSLREIAERLGISKAAVYYHYRSKVEILDDLLRPLADGEEAIINDAAAGSLASPEARVQLIEWYLDLLLTHRELASYVMSDIVGASNSRMVPRLQRHDQQLMQLLVKAELALPEQVRTLSAFGAVVAVLSLGDVPADQLRPIALDAARDVLGVPDDV